MDILKKESVLTVKFTFTKNIDIYLIVLKKLREEDIEEQLTEAFKIIDSKN